MHKRFAPRPGREVGKEACVMSRQGSHDTTLDFPGITRFRDDGYIGMIEALKQAALHVDHDRCAAMLRRACAEGMPPTAMRDVIIPAAARSLGDMWRSDALAFADVTIATARLQGLIRTIATQTPPVTTPHERQAICVVVPAGTHHTLGASILVQQLRQRDLSVRFMLDATPADMRSVLRNGRPDAVFVSSIAKEKLDLVAPIIEEVRKQPAGIPVVVGGPDTISQADIRALTGADHATRDIETALELCGLTPNPPHVAPAEMMS